MASRYLSKQNDLVPKMRFKLASINDLFGSLLGGAQLLFEKNADFLSLCAHDRSLLLQNTMKQTAGLGVCFTLLNSRLFNDPLFYTNCEIIYGEASLLHAVRAISLLDYDIVFVKLILAILIFSTFDYTYYTTNNSTHLTDVKTVLRIQDRYVELTWRYLLYRYDHHRAVICFSNLTRSLFLLNYSIVAVVEVQQYNTMIDSLVKQTEEILRIPDE